MAGEGSNRKQPARSSSSRKSQSNKDAPSPAPSRQSGSSSRPKDGGSRKQNGHVKSGSKSEASSQRSKSADPSSRDKRRTPEKNNDGKPDMTRSRSESKRVDSNNQRRRSRSKSRPKKSQQSSSRPQDDKPKSSQHNKSSNSKHDKQHGNSKTSATAPYNRSKSNGTTRSASTTNVSSGGKKSAAAEFNAKKRAQKFASQAQKAIPAKVRMISGSHDTQTSADVSNVNSDFKLPNPAGKAGGACTAALLQVLFNAHDNHVEDISWVDVLREMRGILEDKGYEQVPQLTSSRMIDVHDPFEITPKDGSFNKKNNTQRAVLIGINYVGQNGQLSGCHNDVQNVAKYLRNVEGFKKENVTILMDDGVHKAPTKSAILSAYKKLVRESKEGDVVFCHYSGHGGRLVDDNGDEDDGYDETLIPVDFQKSGQIRDDDLLKILVHPMPAGVTMTCLMDCCHSGTVLDLPYRFTGDGDIEEMEINERTNFTDALWTGAGVFLGASAASAVVSALTPAPEMMILGGGPNAIHEYSDSDCCTVT